MASAEIEALLHAGAAGSARRPAPPSIRTGIDEQLPWATPTDAETLVALHFADSLVL